MPRPRRSQRKKRQIGTARRDRERATPALPPPPSGVPAWLDKLGQEYWAVLTHRLAEMGLASAHYGELLARLCQLLSFSQQIAEQVQREGLRLGPKPHPLLREYRQMVREAVGLGARFGLTPQDLGRLDLPERADEIDEFLFGKS